MQPRLPVVVAALVLALSGCSFSASVGTKKVSSADLERQVASKSAENDLVTSSVDCPAGLEATVGAVAQCDVLANGLKYTATVKTTEVNGDSVLFDLEVPPPAIVPKEALEEKVASLVEANSDTTVASVACVDEMIGTTGTVVDCEVKGTDGQVLNLVATVTDADFLNVNFNLNEKS